MEDVYSVLMIPKTILSKMRETGISKTRGLCKPYIFCDPTHAPGNLPEGVEETNHG